MSIQKHLKMLFETDIIHGGVSDSMTIADIAERHGVDVDQIRAELEMGIEIEMEHTNDRMLAKELAKDHLWEIRDYYSRLKKMEQDAEDHFGGSSEEQ